MKIKDLIEQLQKLSESEKNLQIKDIHFPAQRRFIDYNREISLSSPNKTDYSYVNFLLQDDQTTQCESDKASNLTIK